MNLNSRLTLILNQINIIYTTLLNSIIIHFIFNTSFKTTKYQLYIHYTNNKLF